MKLKRLPSLKDKKRYLTFKLHSQNPLVYSKMKGAVLNSMINWLGEEGFSSAKVRIIRNLWDEKKGIGWIACLPKSVDDIKMSLALIHQIGDEKVIFQVLRVSGTIKSGKEKIKQ